MNVENPAATITYLLGVLIALQLFILTYLIATELRDWFRDE